MLHLPTHPRTGDRAIGFRKDGRAIWPIKGGSGDGDPTTDPTDDGKTPEPAVTDPAPAPPAPDDGLGDAGKKALTAEREARKSAEKERDEANAELSRLRRANAAQKGTDVDAIKSEIRAEFSEKLTAAAVRAEAKGRLADPSAAARYPEYFADVDSSDEAALADAVGKLLEEHPYLAADKGAQPHWGAVDGDGREPSEPEPRSALERMTRAYGNKS
ncbi:hypothetical protein [Streptomyces sp. NPDC007063]|uniref:hypothetical protein n=1 Tax=Streptomyces sp. NPDC007063 TaxID=3364772 RepID=UPI00369A7826